MNLFKFDVDREVANRDPMIYGHFVEHFHDQIYGGIYNPRSPFADANGFRQDVIEAIRRLNPPVLRWPGGCFVSNYHWQDGIGKRREPTFDKAWRVEDSNEFGTDEFIKLCRSVGAEPYICTNAGTGTAEEMSNWVEYCNLKHEGRWAKKRIANGYREPYAVKYWSIGNENYLPGELGQKKPSEWGVFVREAAKMMKRVDPTIEVMAASVPDLEWNTHLLTEAGPFLDWISIHGYWDHLWLENNVSSYEKCMSYTLEIEERIVQTKYILGAFGYLDKIRIAFDEWNLRGWHHPHVDSATEDYVTPRDKNNIPSTYTMADAVFSACFLNQCLRHADIIGMANYAPTVNTRGMIYVHENGIVLRSTYYVFELYSKYMGDVVIDGWLQSHVEFEGENRQGDKMNIPALDVVATKHSSNNAVSIAIVNRHPDEAIELTFHSDALSTFRDAVIHTVNGSSKDDYNDIDEEKVRIHEQRLSWQPTNGMQVTISPHSVNVLTLSS